MGIIHRFTGREGGWDWEGVPVHEYGPARPGVTVRRFIGRRDRSDNMELRYFELQPGASTNFEKHNFEHAVLVLRGQGKVRLGGQVHSIRPGDAIFIELDEIHQFRADDDSVLGFLCAVLDKALRVQVHGEQTLTSFEGDGTRL